MVYSRDTEVNFLMSCSLKVTQYMHHQRSARVSKLSVSYDYGRTLKATLSKFEYSGRLKENER